jgi:hypothetical protein
MLGAPSQTVTATTHPSRPSEHAVKITENQRVK